jgi:hypothetical protein
MTRIHSVTTVSKWISRIFSKRPLPRFSAPALPTVPSAQNLSPCTSASRDAKTTSEKLSLTPQKKVLDMSLLHRSVLAQIIASLAPLADAVVDVAAPGAAPLVNAGLNAAEQVADAVSGGGSVDASAAATAAQAAAPAASSAPPAAPAAPASSAQAGPVAPLSAADVLAAFAATIASLQAKL